MTNSTDVFWSVDGVSLQTLAHNIESWGGDREAPPTVRKSSVTVPFRKGTQWFPGVVDSRVITLGMWVNGADEDGNVPQSHTMRQEFEKNWKALRKLLWNPKKQLVVTKRFRLYDDPNKIYVASAKASFAGGLSPKMEGELRAVFTVDLLLEDPYFYSEPITILLDPQKPVQDVEILGDARTERIDITLNGFSKRLRIMNETEDFGFEYARELPVGQKAQIDIEDFAATHNALISPVPSAGSISHAGTTNDPYWLAFEPGLQTIAISELDVPSRGTTWENKFTNPSMETAGAAQTVFTNLDTNPGQRQVKAANTVYRTNLLVSPNVGVAAAQSGVQWYGGGTNAGTTSRSTSGGIGNTGYLRKQWTTAASTSGDVGFKMGMDAATRIPVQETQVYTASGYVRRGGTTAANYPMFATISWVDAAGAIIGAASGPGVQATTTFTRASVTATAPKNAVSAFFTVSNLTSWQPAVGTQLDFTAPLFEAADSARPFFCGTTANANGFVTAWSGTTNNSVSTQQASQVDVYRNNITNPSLEISTSANNTRTNQATNPRMEAVPAVTNLARDPRGVDVGFSVPGTYYGYFWGEFLPQAGGPSGFVTTGGPLASVPTYAQSVHTKPATPTPIELGTGWGINHTDISVSGNQQYNFSSYMRSTLSGTSFELRITFWSADMGQSQASVVATSTSVANTWQRISGTATTPSWATQAWVSVRNNDYNNAPTQTLGMSAVMVTTGSTLYDYFDGGLTNTTDWNYSWTGTANQSTSVRQSVAAITAGYEQYDNINPNPSMEGPSALTTIATNLAKNPSLVTAGATTTLRTNLVNNPAVGTNTTGWAATGASTALTRVTGDAPSGVTGGAHAAVTLSAANTNGWGVDIGSNTGPMMPATPGQSYSFSAYAKTVAAQSLNYRVSWYNGTTFLSVSNLGTTTSTANTWTLFGGVATAPASATRAVLSVLMPTTASASGTVLRVSGAFMEASNVATTYFDGGTTSPIPGEYTIGWSGTANSSTSVMTAPTATPFTEAPSLPTGAYVSQSPTIPTGAIGTRALRIRSAPASGTTSFVAWDLSFLAAGTYTLKFLAQFTGTPGANATGTTGYATFGAIDFGSANNISDQFVLNTTAQWITFSFTVPASGDRFLVIRQDMLLGSPDLLVDNFTLIAGSALQDDINYFDGSSSPLAPWVSSWTGTANASTSLLQADTPNGYTAINGSLFKDSYWAAAGAKSGRIRGRKAGGNTYARLSAVQLTPGQTYTAIITTRIDQPLGSPNTAFSRRLGLEVNGGAGVWNTAYTPVNTAGNVAEQRWTFTAPAGNVYMVLGHGSNATPNNDVWFDKFLIMPVLNTSSPFLDEYFDGGSGNFGESFSGWVGTPHASASYLRSPKIVGYGTSPYAQSYASSRWSSSGSTSLRIRPNASGVASYATVDGDAGMGMRIGMQAGKAYTAIAKIRLDAPQTGSLDYRARRIMVFSRIGNGSYLEAMSNQATNAAGVTELRVTFALPAGTTDAFIRLYNGAPDTGRETNNVWYDDFALIEVPSTQQPYVEPYFDGSTAPWADVTSVSWNGNPDASTSSRVIPYAGSYGGATGSGWGYSSTQWSKTGTRSLRIYPASNASNDSYVTNGGEMGALRLDMVAGGSYTLLATRYVPTALTGTLHANAYRALVVYRIGSGTFQVFSTPAETDYTGQKDLRLDFTLPAGTTEASVRFYHGGFAESGDVFWDNLALIPNPPGGTYPGGYFDGDTSMVGPYASFWDGGKTVNSASVVRAVAVAGTTYDSTRSTGVEVYDFLPGTETPALRVKATGTSDSFGNIFTQATLAASTSYLIRGKITLTAPQTGTLDVRARKLVAYNGTAATVVWEQTVPNAAGTYEYIARITTASGAYSSFRAYNGGDSNSPDVFWSDIMVIAGGDESIPFFDGNTTNAGDWSYVWSGTADASTSNQTALGVASLNASTAAVPLSSSTWSNSRGKSVRVFPRSTSNTSYISVNGDSGAMRLGMQAGKTYTVVATCHLEAPQAGSIVSQARRIYVGFNPAGSVVSDQAPNAAGSTELRVTFTVPANATQAWVRLYNGASLGNGDVWWDDFAILEVPSEAEPFVGPYFDGSTPDTDYADYEWSGTPDASTSIIRGVAATEDIAVVYQPAWI